MIFDTFKQYTINIKAKKMEVPFILKIKNQLIQGKQGDYIVELQENKYISIDQLEFEKMINSKSTNKNLTRNTSMNLDVEILNNVIDTMSFEID